RQQDADSQPSGCRVDGLIGCRRSGSQKGVKREVVPWLDEVEALLIVVPRVREQPRLLAERHALDHVRWPGYLVPTGSQPVEQRPADHPALHAQASQQRLRQARLAGADRADDSPGLPLVQRPIQIAKHHLSTRTDDGGVVEKQDAIAMVVWRT